MRLTQNTNGNYTTRQLKLPLEIEKLIDMADPVYTFCEVVDCMDLTKYFVDDKDYKTGCPICDAQKLLKVILFAFMEQGISSLRTLKNYVAMTSALCTCYLSCLVIHIQCSIYNSRNFQGLLVFTCFPDTVLIYNSRNFQGLLVQTEISQLTTSTTVEIFRDYLSSTSKTP